MERREGSGYHPEPRMLRRRPLREESMDPPRDPWLYRDSFHSGYENEHAYASEREPTSCYGDEEELHRFPGPHPPPEPYHQEPRPSYYDERYQSDPQFISYEYDHRRFDHPDPYYDTKYPHSHRPLPNPTDEFWDEESFPVASAGETRYGGPRPGSLERRNPMDSVDSYDSIGHGFPLMDSEVVNRTEELHHHLPLDHAPVFDRLGSASLETRLGPQHHGRSDSAFMSARLGPMHPPPPPAAAMAAPRHLQGRLGPSQENDLSSQSTFAPVHYGSNEPLGPLARLDMRPAEQHRASEAAKYRPVADGVDPIPRPLFDNRLSSRFKAHQVELAGQAKHVSSEPSPLFPELPPSKLSEDSVRPASSSKSSHDVTFSSRSSHDTVNSAIKTEPSLTSSVSSSQEDNLKSFPIHKSTSVTLHSPKDQPVVSSVNGLDPLTNRSTLNLHESSSSQSGKSRSPQRSSRRARSKSRSPKHGSSRHRYYSSSSKSRHSRSPVHGSRRVKQDGSSHSPRRSSHRTSPSVIKPASLKPHHSASSGSTKDRSPKSSSKSSLVGKSSRISSSKVASSSSSSSSRPSTSASNKEAGSRDSVKTKHVVAASSEKVNHSDRDDPSCTCARTRIHSKKPTITLKKITTVVQASDTKASGGLKEAKVSKSANGKDASKSGSGFSTKGDKGSCSLEGDSKAGTAKGKPATANAAAQPLRSNQPSKPLLLITKPSTSTQRAVAHQTQQCTQKLHLSVPLQKSVPDSPSKNAKGTSTVLVKDQADILPGEASDDDDSDGGLVIDESAALQSDYCTVDEEFLAPKPECNSVVAESGRLDESSKSSTIPLCDPCSVKNKHVSRSNESISNVVPALDLQGSLVAPKFPFPPDTSPPSTLEPNQPPLSVPNQSTTRPTPEMYAPQSSLPVPHVPSSNLQSAALSSLFQSSALLPSQHSSDPVSQASALPPSVQAASLPKPPSLLPASSSTLLPAQTNPSTLPALSQPLPASLFPQDPRLEKRLSASVSQPKRDKYNQVVYNKAVEVLGVKLTDKFVEFADQENGFNILREFYSKAANIVQMFQWKMDNGSSMNPEILPFLRETFAEFYTGAIDGSSVPTSPSQLFNRELEHLRSKCGDSIERWKVQLEKYILLASKIPLKKRKFLRQLSLGPKNAASTLGVPSTMNTDLSTCSTLSKAAVDPGAQTEPAPRPLMSVKIPSYVSQLSPPLPPPLPPLPSLVPPPPSPPPVSDPASSETPPAVVNELASVESEVSRSNPFALVATLSASLSGNEAANNPTAEVGTLEKSTSAVGTLCREVKHVQTMEPLTVEKATDTAAIEPITVEKAIGPDSIDKLENIVQEVQAHLARRTDAGSLQPDPPSISELQTVEKDPSSTGAPQTMEHFPSAESPECVEAAQPCNTVATLINTASKPEDAPVLMAVEETSEVDGVSCSVGECTETTSDLSEEKSQAKLQDNADLTAMPAQQDASVNATDITCSFATAQVIVTEAESLKKPTEDNVQPNEENSKDNETSKQPTSASRDLSSDSLQSTMQVPDQRAKQRSLSPGEIISPTPSPQPATTPSEAPYLKDRHSPPFNSSLRYADTSHYDTEGHSHDARQRRGRSSTSRERDNRTRDSHDRRNRRSHERRSRPSLSPRGGRPSRSRLRSDSRSRSRRQCHRRSWSYSRREHRRRSPSTSVERPRGIRSRLYSGEGRERRSNRARSFSSDRKSGGLRRGQSTRESTSGRVASGCEKSCRDSEDDIELLELKKAVIISIINKQNEEERSGHVSEGGMADMELCEMHSDQDDYSTRDEGPAAIEDTPEPTKGPSPPTATSETKSEAPDVSSDGAAALKTVCVETAQMENSAFATEQSVGVTAAVASEPKAPDCGSSPLPSQKRAKPKRVKKRSAVDSKKKDMKNALSLSQEQSQSCQKTAIAKSQKLTSQPNSPKSSPPPASKLLHTRRPTGLLKASKAKKNPTEVLPSQEETWTIKPFHIVSAGTDSEESGDETAADSVKQPALAQSSLAADINKLLTEARREAEATTGVAAPPPPPPPAPLPHQASSTSALSRARAIPSPPSPLPPDRQKEYRALQKKLAQHKKKKARTKARKKKAQYYSRCITELSLRIKTHRSVLETEQEYLNALTEELTACETDIDEHDLKMTLYYDQLMLLQDKLLSASCDKKTAEQKRMDLQSKVRTTKEKILSCNEAITESVEELDIQKYHLQKLEKQVLPSTSVASGEVAMESQDDLSNDTPSLSASSGQPSPLHAASGGASTSEQMPSCIPLSLMSNPSLSYVLSPDYECVSDADSLSSRLPSIARVDNLVSPLNAINTGSNTLHVSSSSTQFDDVSPAYDSISEAENSGVEDDIVHKFTDKPPSMDSVRKVLPVSQKGSSLIVEPVSDLEEDSAGGLSYMHGQTWPNSQKPIPLETVSISDGEDDVRNVTVDSNKSNTAQRKSINAETPVAIEISCAGNASPTVDSDTDQVTVKKSTGNESAMHGKSVDVILKEHSYAQSPDTENQASAAAEPHASSSGKRSEADACLSDTSLLQKRPRLSSGTKEVATTQSLSQECFTALLTSQLIQNAVAGLLSQSGAPPTLTSLPQLTNLPSPSGGTPSLGSPIIFPLGILPVITASGPTLLPTLQPNKPERVCTSLTSTSTSGDHDKDRTPDDEVQKCSSDTGAKASSPNDAAECKVVRNKGKLKRLQSTSGSTASEPFRLQRFCDSALSAALHSSLSDAVSGVASSSSSGRTHDAVPDIRSLPVVSSLLQNTIRSLTLGDMMSTSVLMRSVMGDQTPSSGRDRLPVVSEVGPPSSSLEKMEDCCSDDDVPSSDDVEEDCSSTEDIDSKSIFLETDNRLFTVSPSASPLNLPLPIFDADSDPEYALQVTPSGIHPAALSAWRQSFDELTAQRKLILESSAVESMQDQTSSLDHISQPSPGAFKPVVQPVKPVKPVEPVIEAAKNIPVEKLRDIPKVTASPLKKKKPVRKLAKGKTASKIPEAKSIPKPKPASSLTQTSTSKDRSQSSKNLRKDIKAVQEQLQQLKDQLASKIAAQTSSLSKGNKSSLAKHGQFTAATTLKKEGLKSLSNASSSSSNLASGKSKPGALKLKLAAGKLMASDSKRAPQAAKISKLASVGPKTTASKSSALTKTHSGKSASAVKSSLAKSVQKQDSDGSKEASQSRTLPGSSTALHLALTNISIECKVSHDKLNQLQAVVSTSSQFELNFDELLDAERPNSGPSSLYASSLPNRGPDVSPLFPESFCAQQMEAMTKEKKAGLEKYHHSSAGYEPYVSPLLQFQSHRLGAISRTATKDTVKVLLRSHKYDPQRIMCRFELLGTCNDPKCTAQHFKDCEKKQASDSSAVRVSSLQNASKKASAGASSVSMATSSSATEQESPSIEVVPLQPVEDGSSCQFPRYFTRSDSESLAALTERVQTTPSDGEAWLTLAETAWQQTGKAKSQTLLEGLKSCRGNKQSEQLWVGFLKAKHQEDKASSELSRMRHKAVLERASYAIVFECVRQCEKFDVKLNFLVKGLSSLRGESRLLSKDCVSHQCLEFIFNIALLYCTHGKTQEAVSSLKDHLFSSSASVVRFLSLQDKQVACLSLVYLAHAGQLPSTLFDRPMCQHPARIVDKELSELHWKVGSGLSEEKRETITDLFKACIELCEDTTTAGQPLEEQSVQLCLPLRLNLVRFRAAYSSQHEAVSMYKELAVASPNCLEVWLHLFKICGKETAKDMLEPAIKSCHPLSPRLYYTVACMELSSTSSSSAEGEDKRRREASVERAVGWLKKCVGKFYQNLPDTDSLTVPVVHFLYRKLLSQLVPYDYETPAFADGVAPGQLGKVAAPLWLCYCLLVELSPPQVPTGGFFHASVEDAFESAVHSIQTRAGYVALWRAYLSHSRRLAAEMGSEAAFKLYSECVHRSVLAIETHRSYPWSVYGQPDGYQDHSFQNEVVEQLLSSLPFVSGYKLATLQKFVKLFPKNHIMVARLVECMLDQSSEQVECAQSTLANFLAQNPQCSILWKMAIAIEMKLKKSKQARWMYHQAVTALPLNAQLWKEFLMFEFKMLASSSNSSNLFLAAVKKANEAGFNLSTLLF